MTNSQPHDERPVPLRPGDRVRICRADSEYTGCRGSVAQAPGAAPGEQGMLPLGYFVAIDGENGVTRPFLAEDLEVIRPAAVRRNVASGQRVEDGANRQA